MSDQRVSIIVAVDEKGGIGKDNKIPWHIKDDLKRLKALTLNNTVILGRKSYDSMVWYYNKSGRPMPGKRYIVVTRDTAYAPERENAVIAHSLEEALDKAENEGNEICIIGGAQIFKEAIEKDVVDRLYLTIVKGDYQADTFFPKYSPFTRQIEREDKEEEGFQYTFLTLEKA